MRRLLQTTLAVAVFVTFGSVVGSADLNSAAIAIKLPAQIPWVESPSGAAGICGGMAGGGGDCVFGAVVGRLGVRSLRSRLRVGIHAS